MTMRGIFFVASALVVLSVSVHAQSHQWQWPIRVSENHRYLVDSSGKPFFALGDSLWETHLYSPDEVELIFEDRSQKGFTVLCVATGCEGDLTNYRGDEAFVGDDLSRPNEAYWQHIDFIIQAALDRNMAVMFNPIWIRHHRKRVDASGRNGCRGYGEWLARRFQQFENVMYFIGGDHPPRDEKDELEADGPCNRIGCLLISVGVWILPPPTLTERLLSALPQWKNALEITGPWKVCFNPELAAPAESTFDKLIPYTAHPDENIRYYSSKATYVKTFDVPAALVSGKEPIFLDPGDVKELAEVKLNGASLGVLWSAPWRIEVTGKLKPGANTLEVDVTNTWHNRMLGEIKKYGKAGTFDEGNPKAWLGKQPTAPARLNFPSGRAMDVGDEPLPAGLLGTTQLETEGTWEQMISKTRPVWAVRLGGPAC